MLQATNHTNYALIHINKITSKKVGANTMHEAPTTTGYEEVWKQELKLCFVLPKQQSYYQLMETLEKGCEV